jgi:hypothetical protein
MRRTFPLILTTLMLGISSFAQDVKLYQNNRIFASSITQTEPVIALHPTIPMTMFASGRTINTNGGFQSEGVYLTTNGGVTWFGSDTCKGASIDNHGGDPGIAIHPDGRLILTHIGLLQRGMYSHYSTDFGATWSNANTIFYNSAQPPDDKGQTTAIDNSMTSPFYGRVYAAWADLGSPFTVLSSYSTNGAQTWSTATSVNPSPPAHCSGSFVTVGLNGRVYVCWVGIITVSPFTEDFVGFATSTDGGVNWRITQNAFDINGIRGTLPSKSNILVNGLPQLEVDRSGGTRSGWIYVVTGERNLSPAGSDPDIVLHRSTDNGITWSGGIRVNQDAINNGRTQYFPAIDVDYQGGVNIIYYDDRNTSADSSEIILARSLDGGNTWTERVISDHRFKPKPIPGFSSGYQGDHIALTSVSNKLYAFWMDDFFGLYQIWTCQIDLQSLGVALSEPRVPTVFELKQNYPNPFNPTTTIRFSLPSLSANQAKGRGGVGLLVILKVYDLLGREVATLVNEPQQPGERSVVFDAERLNLSSGMYFYRLTAGDYSATKSTILLK